MKQVEMIVYGKRALVDSDMVKKIVRKELLFNQAQELEFKLNLESDSIRKQLLKDSLNEIMGKIIRLNRSIRPCVEFI